MRPKPLEPNHQRYGAHFDRMCAVATEYWRNNIVSPTNDSPMLVVELLTQDIRASIRNLTLANAVRRSTPARLVVLIGPDHHWNDHIWQYYDPEPLTRLAMAAGADEVLHLDEIRQQVAGGRSSFKVLLEPRQVPGEPDLPAAKLAAIATATALRILRAPAVSDEVRSDPAYADIVADTSVYARLFSALLPKSTLAFITSHIDYHQWGCAVEVALANQIPVIHMQSTGSLKAYAVFPERVQQAPEASFRMHITRELGAMFDHYLWPRRDLLRRSAELTAWRAKSNLGRPSWWRGGGAVSQQNFHSSAERRSVRTAAMQRLGFDQGKPVLCVFAHAVSDALGTNHEAFASLADWFEQTVHYAVEHPEVNWLFVDHPSQAHYDATEHFEALAAEHSEHSHMVFRPSMALTRNALWSLADCAVTVRGSVSNEFPAYGIPAIQAGWSEWSHCGFTRRADTEAEYWQILEDMIFELRTGAEVITPEQIERARLWMWFYRCGADVASSIAPQWDLGRANTLYIVISQHLSQIDSDADASFIAVQRMWDRREAVLTRLDFTDRDEDFVKSIGPVGGFRSPLLLEPDLSEPIRTAMDTPRRSMALPALVESGQSTEIVLSDGMVRGVKILGRASRASAVLGFKVPATQPLRIEIKLARDGLTHKWWQRAASEEARGRVEGANRVIEVSCQGEPRGHAIYKTGKLARQTLRFDLDGARLERDGLLMITLDGIHDYPDALENGLIGMAVDSVSIAPLETQTGLVWFEAIPIEGYRPTPAEPQIPLELGQPDGVGRSSAQALSVRRLKRALAGLLRD